MHDQRRTPDIGEEVAKCWRRSLRRPGLNKTSAWRLSLTTLFAVALIGSGCGAGQQSETKVLGGPNTDASEIADRWDISLRRRTVIESASVDGLLPELGTEHLSVLEGPTGSWAQVSLVQIRTSGQRCEMAIVAQRRHGADEPVADGYFEDSDNDDGGYLPATGEPSEDVADGYLGEDSRRDGYFRGSLTTSNADVAPIRSYTADLGRGCEIGMHLYESYVDVVPNDACREPSARSCDGDAHWSPTRYALSGAAGGACGAGHEPSSWAWDDCAE